MWEQQNPESPGDSESVGECINPSAVSLSSSHSCWLCSNGLNQNIKHSTKRGCFKFCWQFGISWGETLSQWIKRWIAESCILLTHLSHQDMKVKRLNRGAKDTSWLDNKANITKQNKTWNNTLLNTAQGPTHSHQYAQTGNHTHETLKHLIIHIKEPVISNQASTACLYTTR